MSRKLLNYLSVVDRFGTEVRMAYADVLFDKHAYQGIVTYQQADRCPIKMEGSGSHQVPTPHVSQLALASTFFVGIASHSSTCLKFIWLSIQPLAC
jgi:hypothetical protein